MKNKKLKFSISLLAIFLIVIFSIAGYYGVKIYLHSSHVGAVNIIDRDYNIAFNKIGFQIIKQISLNNINNFMQQITHGSCRVTITNNKITLEDTSKPSDKKITDVRILESNEKIDTISAKLETERCRIWYIGDNAVQ